MAIDMQALRACVFQKTIAVICSKRKTTPFATVVMLFNQLSPILKTQNSELKTHLFSRSTGFTLHKMNKSWRASGGNSGHDQKE